MLKLLKLEWKKNQLSKYIKSVLFCMVVIFGLSCLMAVLSNNEGEAMFYDKTSFLAFVNMMIRIVFEVFGAIILGRLVIDEYRNKTIQVLFTYPVNRKKIIQYKLLIVCLFTFVNIVAATVITGILTYFLNPILHLFEGSITINNLVSNLPTDLLSAFMIAGISLIPLYFGMRNKSTATTITSAVIVSILLNSTVSGGESSASLFEFIGIPIIFCIIGLAIGYLGYKNINKKDIA